MSKSIKLSRRGFMAAQAGVVAVGASGAASAAVFSRPVSWATMTRKDLSPLIGETFTARTEDGQKFDLKLVDAELVKSGWHRPMDLARREGVVAVFDSPHAAKLAEAGHQTVRLHHPQLGSAEIFLGAVPSRSKGHLIEAIFN